MAESHGAMRSIGNLEVDSFWCCFFFAGSCAEHWAEADPALIEIVTLEVAAEFGSRACRFTEAFPADVVVTLAFAMVCTRPNVFAWKHSNKIQMLHTLIYCHTS